MPHQNDETAIDGVGRGDLQLNSHLPYLLAHTFPIPYQKQSHAPKNADQNKLAPWPLPVPTLESSTQSHPTSPPSNLQNPSPPPKTRTHSSGSEASQIPTAQSHTRTNSPNHSDRPGPSLSLLSARQETAGAQVALPATQKKSPKSSNISENVVPTARSSCKAIRQDVKTACNT